MADECSKGASLDFLGFNIRKCNGKLIIKMSKKSQERFAEKLHETIFRWNKTATLQALIDQQDPILRGWARETIT
ncbi:MAG: hypothetical protein IKR05_10385 [Prevotella sp.]|nr:hypothetical protein [Prevotella sp.]